MKKGLIIAIDGPAAAGKSTVGKLLAKEFHYTYIDTGAMYRALAWKALQLEIDLDDEASLRRLVEQSEISLQNTIENNELKIQVYWNGEELTAHLRTPQVGMAASKISALPAVRLTMVDLQRKIGQDGAVVMDGRDIGSFVFPYADKKFFLEASLDERARRRFQEIKEKDSHISYQDIRNDLYKRDHNDRSRALAPLIKAEDAILIDSTQMQIEEVVSLIKREINR